MLKHIYISPSSVDGADSSRATRASKAAIAGMTGITIEAIADGAVKVCAVATVSTSRLFFNSACFSHN
jgi:hypothetical protein